MLSSNSPSETSSEPSLLGRSLRFAVVGVVTAVIHYGLLALGVEMLGLGSTLASSIGFIVAVSFNYFMHYSWTFAAGPGQETSPHGRTLLRYLVMISCGFVINGGFMYLGVNSLQWHYLLVQAGTLVAVVLWNFTLSNAWVFRP